jgi:hypothetical protein
MTEIINTGIEQFNVVRTTTDYTASNEEIVIADGGVTVTLPSPSQGATVIVKQLGSSVFLQTPSGTIVNQNNKAKYAGADGLYLISDGTNWYTRSDLQDVLPAIPDSATIAGSTFADSFDDETADSGIPENFEASAAGVPETVEVISSAAVNGEQSCRMLDGGDGGSEGIRPSEQPYSSSITDPVEVFIQTKASTGRGGQLHLLENGNTVVQVNLSSDGLQYDDGSVQTVDSTDPTDEWVRIKVFNIDTSTNQFDLDYEYLTSGNSGTVTVDMVNSSSEGYDVSKFTLFAGDEAYFDTLLIGE